MRNVKRKKWWICVDYTLCCGLQITALSYCRKRFANCTDDKLILDATALPVYCTTSRFSDIYV